MTGRQEPAPPDYLAAARDLPSVSLLALAAAARDLPSVSPLALAAAARVLPSTSPLALAVVDLGRIEPRISLGSAAVSRRQSPARRKVEA
jgi:hypothetical protein